MDKGYVLTACRIHKPLLARHGQQVSLRPPTPTAHVQPFQIPRAGAHGRRFGFFIAAIRTRRWS